MNLLTLQIGDPSCHFFKLQVWAEAAGIVAGKLCVGQLVCFDNLRIEVWRGKAKANFNSRSRLHLVKESRNRSGGRVPLHIAVL